MPEVRVGSEFMTPGLAIGQQESGIGCFIFKFNA